MIFSYWQLTRGGGRRERPNGGTGLRISSGRLGERRKNVSEFCWTLRFLRLSLRPYNTMD